MKATRYNDTYEGLIQSRRMHQIALVGLSIALVLLAIVAVSKRAPVIIDPPGLSERGVIEPSNANAAVLEAWGMHFAQLLGNATPRSAEFVADALSPHIDGSAHEALITAIREQAETIKSEQISVQFTPTTVFYVPEDRYVVVSGEYVIHGLRNSQSRSVRTYEVGVRVRNYQVSVTSLDTYDGPWQPNKAKRQANTNKKKA